MLHLSNTTKLLIPGIILSFMGLQSCAYYNTFYNAEQYFAEAQKLTRDNQTETVSTQEINLYSKSIEKSKKLLQGYPDSKYRDDAQFLIAQSYYFKGDYSLAKRYFEDLSLHYASSPYSDEVLLWIGRCLLKVGDLEMARHEASRIIKGNANRSLQSDALLLMGEIAVEQDSLALAENYLEQVIDRSPDGFTKAQAQFQVGKMRENKLDFSGALEAYEAVTRFRPSESLKVEAIIRQTSMLKALNRDEDAVAMIKDMLVSDKFVDIRGKLEVELGKLYIVMGEIEKAETKLKSIVQEYSRQEVAAEASFVLGEMYLIHMLDYPAAKAAFSDVKTQAVRSPFVKLGVERNKQIARYEKIQLDHTNFHRQLSGRPALVKDDKKGTAKGRGSRSSKSRGRSRSTKPGNPNSSSSRNKKNEEVKSMVIVAVTAEDSARFYSGIDENRYSLAEYMLFEFARVDSAIDILTSLESTSQDTGIKQQSAYMRYYALESVKGDPVASQVVMEHIQQVYPEFYNTVMEAPKTKEDTLSLPEIQFQEILALFDAGMYSEASQQYLLIKNDSTISSDLRGKSCFNYAWLNDHFLYDKDAALEAYTYMAEHFPDHPLTTNSRARQKLLTAGVVKTNPAPEVTNQDQDVSSPEEALREKEPSSPKGPKPGEKEK